MAIMVPRDMTSHPQHWLYPEFQFVRPSFETYFHPARGEKHAINWRPEVDLMESDGSYLVLSEIPGVDMNKLDILVDGKTLTIKGTKADPDLENCSIHCVECCYGPFHRTIELPSPVEPDEVEATYNLGVLKIKLPKIAKAKPIKVEVI